MIRLDIHEQTCVPGVRKIGLGVVCVRHRQYIRFSDQMHADLRTILLSVHLLQNTQELERKHRELEYLELDCEDIYEVGTLRNPEYFKDFWMMHLRSQTPYSESRNNGLCLWN